MNAAATVIQLVTVAQLTRATQGADDASGLTTRPTASIPTGAAVAGH
jgi:hypothetical protein